MCVCVACPAMQAMHAYPAGQRQDIRTYVQTALMQMSWIVGYWLWVMGDTSMDRGYYGKGVNQKGGGRGGRGVATREEDTKCST